MVFRVYVEKKKELANEARALAADIRTTLGITGLTDLRLFNRYDVENMDKDLFEQCKTTVFSEPPLDVVSDSLNVKGAFVFAVEYLPGQFDQRADSAAQCIQIISQGERPLVRAAKVYALYGVLTPAERERIKKYVINPVEAREASLDACETLAMDFQAPHAVATIKGFTTFDNAALHSFQEQYGLAMDMDDLRFCQDYFKGERRDPTITEIKVIDTYWSDHCRHTTFQTIIDNVTFENDYAKAAYDQYRLACQKIGRGNRPLTLMNIATSAARYMKHEGKLDALDESDEINACTVKIKVEASKGPEDWLLLFKNETHNHPTEIEPFGGAATCIGGAIRDPLSGRAYVYGAMRVTGAADPLEPVSKTLKGKLPQRKIVTSAAAGYSSYGNQIGIATGIVDEIYHEGYKAKRMEVGAVIAATPAANVRRERPQSGDAVILLGGRTGRDGCGGATGSSKSHDVSSLATCGAEVQKGNAPEERKLQRLFRNSEAARLIKKCNDFGAGGVSVAIGELAEGLAIELDMVPKKYEGLDGTELAISESQERMAVVVDGKDVPNFLELAAAENIEATVVARVTDGQRLTMRWNGADIVDLSRAFLDSNGAAKHTSALVENPQPWKENSRGTFSERLQALAGDLNVCSKRGLTERFDSTIGRGTVLMPFGGRLQLTPAQAMVQKISMEKDDSRTCSLMAWGFNPYISEKSPFHGAYVAVVDSIAKLVASGAEFKDVYLSFQEYFEKLGHDPRRWGKPLAALLGAFRAQMELGTAAIGGKDSMSGSFEQLDVPPTLVSFAVTTAGIKDIISPEFKAAGHEIRLLTPQYGKDGLPQASSLLNVFKTVTSLVRSGVVCAAYAVNAGGAAEAIMKMSFGNFIGAELDSSVSLDDLFACSYGAFVLELQKQDDSGIRLGVTTKAASISMGAEKLALTELLKVYEDKLEPIYPTRTVTHEQNIELPPVKATKHLKARQSTARPRAVIPVFPGTNCEYDTARALELAGAAPEIIVIRNLTAGDIARSAEYFAKQLAQSQIMVIPGGFSGGDEPDGSGKFITAFFRNAILQKALSKMLDENDGLVCGICNGFQALIKLGLVPYGKITAPTADSPTLTYNTIGRHQSRLVRTKVISNKSPWLMETEPGDVFTIPISHGEGRFLASETQIKELAAAGQITAQYVGLDGRPSNDDRCNPNGSDFAIEAITSPDGRILGKMGHSERIGDGLYINIPGRCDMGLFRSAVKYFA